MNQVRLFIFKKGLLWIGWILTVKEPEPIPYYDNNPWIVVDQELDIAYMTMGFSENRVRSRLIKYIEKLRESRKELE